MASPSKKFVIPKKKRSNPETSESSVKAEPRDEPEYVSPLKRGSVKRERNDESSSSKADTEEDYLKLMESKSGFSISRKEDLPKVNNQYVVSIGNVCVFSRVIEE